MNKSNFLHRIIYAVIFLFTFSLYITVSFDMVNAGELTPDLTVPGGNPSSLHDGSHSSSLSFNSGDTITVKSADGSPISGIYIIWDSPVKPWTLTTDMGDVSCGQNGFLHEYIKLSTPSSQAVINIPDNSIRISDIRIFSDDKLPDDVQVWNPPCEKTDIMIVAAHADDDILFFGGIIPTYSVVKNADVQVIFMSEFWSTAKIREHEKLDGLWAAGLKNYPVSADFPDLYSKDLEGAKAQYNFDDVIKFLIGEIRRFEPQVIVSHDRNGEYGHGFHMLTSEAVIAAVEAAADNSSDSDSIAAYGAWNTPKTYIHLYGENKIRLDLRVPIDSMGGRTALEIAADAYKKHVSQQWCWFYVSDDYEYSCADFGLYRTTVGYDTGNDLLENIKTYKVQAAEAESISIAERESMEKAEQERISAEQESSIRESERQSSVKQQEAEQKASKTRTIIITAIAMIIAVVLGIVVMKMRKHL